MATSTSSGSIYPSTSLIDQQLNFTEGHVEPVSSQRVVGGIVPLWDKAVQDLTRLSDLEVNGSIIYANSQINSPAVIRKVDYIFQQIESRVDSTTVAMRAAHLMNQGLALHVLGEIYQQKGLIGKDGIITHVCTKKKQITKLTADTSKFTLVWEGVIQKTNCLDIDQQSFFKVKMTVQGSVRDLENKESGKLSIKAAYTAEKGTQEEALKSDYFGTRAGMFDSTSYLKA